MEIEIIETPVRFRLHALSHIFQSLERQNLDHVSGWLGFEDGFLFCERVDSLAGFGSRFADHFHFHQGWKIEDTRPLFAEVLFNQFCKFVEYAGDLFLTQARTFRQSRDDFALAHCLSWYCRVLLCHLNSLSLRYVDRRGGNLLTGPVNVNVRPSERCVKLR